MCHINCYPNSLDVSCGKLDDVWFDLETLCSLKRNHERETCLKVSLIICNMLEHRDNPLGIFQCSQLFPFVWDYSVYLFTNFPSYIFTQIEIQFLKNRAQWHAAIFYIFLSSVHHISLFHTFIFVFLPYSISKFMLRLLLSSPLPSPIFLLTIRLVLLSVCINPINYPSHFFVMLNAMNQSPPVSLSPILPLWSSSPFVIFDSNIFYFFLSSFQWFPRHVKFLFVRCLFFVIYPSCILTCSIHFWYQITPPAVRLMFGISPVS